MNTLNFFLTLDTTANDIGPGPCGGNANLDCRGADADQPLEFRASATSCCRAVGLNADVLGLNEIENTPGVDPLAEHRQRAPVVLMEVADDRRFLLADTGISVAPKLLERLDILRSVVELAQALGAESPRVALMAATESVNAAMPETAEAAELQARNQAGEFADCVIQGPLSFDLAYAADAADKKR